MKQKENGRTRHLGFSAHGSVDVIRRFLYDYGSNMEFCQLQLNYMDWHFQGAKEKVELVQSAGLPVWVVESLRGGRLAKATDDMTEELLQLRPGEKIPAWAFCFLQSISGVTMVLSGMPNLQQLKANLEIWQENKTLTQEEFDTLVRLADEETRKGGRVRPATIVPAIACRNFRLRIYSHCIMNIRLPEEIFFHLWPLAACQRRKGLLIV